ncbi:hypothetical protein HZB78_03360 [Candidatus Collierbacteria bacterium]|nr:hypothetical protein [Candidatus Collierbacteria bacterium]
MNTKPKFFSFSIGFLAAAGLFLFYSLTMRLLAGSWDAAWWQFRQLWYLMLPLVAGFGVQVGLFYYLKSLAKSVVGKGMMAAGSATSTVSMIACCAHHLADVVPILGLSALSLWLVNFQAPLLAIGIASNIVGSVYLWRQLSRLKEGDQS